MYTSWKRSRWNRRDTFDDGDLRQTTQDSFDPESLSPTSPPIAWNKSRRYSEPGTSLGESSTSSTIGSPPLGYSTSRSSISAKSRDRKDEPLGLHVLHTPAGNRAIDLVFVHGLGGTCRFTWSYDKNLALFWPQEWLPVEPGFENARVLTFGYNAYFKSASKDDLSISDFAKSLLLQLKVASDEHREPLNMGQVPIIFVVHSMGGLIVKKAYILGSHDPQYQDIINKVCGMVFLATPHRGSNLAEVLNRLLSVSFHTPKQYVSDLQTSSTRILDINDQFKHFQGKLNLVSFFETQATSLPLGRKAIVVDRESAILDYPNETSAPLDATHTSISKFPDRTDVNYVQVCNVLRHLIEKVKDPVKTPVTGLRSRTSFDKNSLKSVTSIDTTMTRLGVEPRPNDTLESLWDHYLDRSCDWMFSDTNLEGFLFHQSAKPMLVHITGRPGSGKSMMATFLIKRLEGMGFPVQFWYFRHDDQLKRNNRNCLLSLAFQMMIASEEYAQKVFAPSQDITPIARSDLRTLWQKLFVHLLDKIGSSSATPQPMYWVIDALDESESSQAFLGLFSHLKSLRFPLRVIFLTRLHTMTAATNRLRIEFPPERLLTIPLSTPRDSLELYVFEKLNYTHWGQEVKDSIMDRLIEKSEGCYLWLSLILRELVNCDTEEQLAEVLDKTPDQLVDVYSQIEATISRELRPADRRLVNLILAWVTCAERQLQKDELTEALKPEHMLNLKATTRRLCGDFVAIDKKDNFSMIHYTAKEYLLSQSSSALAVNALEAHTLIFRRCFSVLTDPRFRIRLRSEGCTGFIRYCCLSWSHHLARSDIANYGTEFAQEMAAFFNSTACLAWIEAVAIAGQLHVLTSTAKILVSFVESYHRISKEFIPLVQPVVEMDLLHSWSSELVRIVGKFGLHLSQHPGCIHSLIPLFCPADSMMSQHLRWSGLSAPRITGVSNTHWDDSLAKFTLGHGQSPKTILCHDTLFGIVTSDKTVVIHSASTFQQVARLDHQERVMTANFNSEGTLMVTGGLRTIKVWEVPDGRELCRFPNPDGMRAMDAVFTSDSSEIIVCCVDSNIRRQKVSEPEDWVQIHWQTNNEASLGRGGGTPSCVAFSPDGSQIAISHRTVPLTVWDTKTGNRIGRAEGRRGRHLTRRDNVDYPVRLTWCSGASEHIVGIFTNGTIFKWYPPDPQLEEMPDSPVATEIACSPDGRLIVSAQRDGSLKILSFESFSVVYNLHCAVRAQSVALSPDGRRIYDLRQSFCNVWEPNALIRMAEQDEKASDTASSHYDGSVAYSLGSEAVAVILEPVTTICASSVSTAIMFGTAGGKVKYQDEKGFLVEMSISPISMTCSTLSDCGKFFAAASMDNRVVVRRTPSDDLSVDLNHIFTTQASGAITQLLFGSDSRTLVVNTHKESDLWSLDNGSRLATWQTDSDGRGLWMENPYSSRALLFITSKEIESRLVTDMADTVASERWQIQVTDVEETVEDRMLRLAIEGGTEETISTNTPSMSVSKAFLTPRKSLIFLSLSENDPLLGTKGKHKRFSLLDTRFLSISPSQTTDRIAHSKPLPKQVSSLIKQPLGFVSDEPEVRRGSRDPTTHRPSLGSISRPASNQFEEQCSLAFIDHDFWVRSWSIDDVDGNCRYHFFLPQDWVNMESLAHAVMTTDGRFICPRNGEVATVHHAIKLNGAEEV